MLEVKNVTKYYGKTKAVDNLSFKVAAGKILAYQELMGRERLQLFV